MAIKKVKTKKLIFHHPNLGQCIFASCIFGVELISEVKLLGDVFTDTLHLMRYVNYIFKVVQSALLPSQEIQRSSALPETADVFDVIVLSRYNYCICAWYIFYRKS